MLLYHLWQQIIGKSGGKRVLDLCAAPGGKSTLLASLLDDKSLLISNDVIRSRASILDESMTRWGYINTWVTSNDPRDFGRMPGYFDVMVVDAPCSGSGLFRKDPRALNEWSEEVVQMCAARQQRILADAWPCLKEDGVLFYATCSYSPEEDEAMLDWLAETYDVASFLQVPVDDSWGVITVHSTQKNLIGYRCFPDKVSGEGFFIAALRKREAAQPFYYPRFRATHMKKAEEASRHLLRAITFTILENDRRAATAIYPWHEPDHHFLRDIVYLRKGGIRLGTAVQKDWIPEHDVALSLDKHPSLPQWAMSREEALRFLKKEELAPPGLARGWYVAAYEGRGLGWVKVLGNRVNNYLPKGWRIRMELPEDAAGDWAE